LTSHLNSKINATFCFKILPCAGSWSELYLFGTPHFILWPVLGKRSLCSCLFVVWIVAVVLLAGWLRCVWTFLILDFGCRSFQLESSWLCS
jgi:hypothetical protein